MTLATRSGPGEGTCGSADDDPSDWPSSPCRRNVARPAAFSSPRRVDVVAVLIGRESFGCSERSLAMTGEGLLSSSDEGTLSSEAELAFECRETFFFFFLREEKDGGIGSF